MIRNETSEGLSYWKGVYFAARLEVLMREEDLSNCEEPQSRSRNSRPKRFIMIITSTSSCTEAT